VLYLKLWRLLAVHWRDSTLALLIERRYPAFQSSLVTTVQAAKPAMLGTALESDDHPGRSNALQLARDRSLALIETVDVHSMVRMRPLQIQLIVLGILLAFSCVIALSSPSWTLHWAKRLFGLSNDPWPRYTQLGVDGIEMEVPTFTGRNVRQRYLVPFQNGIASVPKGQACQLKAFAKRTAKTVPDLCTVYYQDAAGNRGRANMRRLTAERILQPFVLDGPPLESVNDSLWLSITGGDSRISNLQLKSVDAPMVTELNLRVIYPDYLQRSTKTSFGSESIPYRAGTRLPQGTRIEVQVKANQPLSKCDYVLFRSGDSSEQKDAPENTVTLPNGVEEFPLEIGSLNGNMLLELRLWGQDGICSNRIQQFVVTAITDQPPQVDMVLEGIGTAITENAVLPVAAKIKDDYDIRKAWLETALDDSPIQKSFLEVERDGRARSQLDLKELRDQGRLIAKVGSTLGLTLAADDFADFSTDPHTGRANPIQLGIVTPEQLLILLDRRELAMRARLEQIIGELTQLRDLQIILQKADGGENEDSSQASSPEDSRSRKERMQMLRSQQAAAQLMKSQGELRGVEKEISQINQELINNRIDSAERRTRLEDKVRKPMLVVLDEKWPEWEKELLSIEKLCSGSTNSDDLGKKIASSIQRNNEIVVMLSAILNDMIDIQDFNEVIGMLRGMVDDQDKVLEKTKQEKRKQQLELLKK
jgi:hypothetical protein